MLSLCARLEAGPALLQTELNRSVIADLEVKGLKPWLAPPVAAIEVRAPLKGQSAGTNLAALESENPEGALEAVRLCM